MTNKQTKIKIIEADLIEELETKANKFCENKNIINIKLYLSVLSMDRLIIIYNE